MSLSADSSGRSSDGLSLVHIAAQSDLLEMMVHLVKLGFPVDDTDNDGRTPMHLSLIHI